MIDVRSSKKMDKYNILGKTRYIICGGVFFDMKQVSQLSLREKIGQMLICGFQGTTLGEELVQLIKENHIGGVIYFSRNLENPKQVHQLSKDLQEINREAGNPPLIISIDQEGGVVSRLVEGVTLFPGNMALGATRDTQGVYEAAKISGEELRALGINLNYAPCVDLYNNPLNPVIGVRAYGQDPVLVGEMGKAAVRGYQESNVAASIKHFPGHGDTNIDSHLDLPVIEHQMERLLEVELIPFKAGIEEQVDVIMTAHILFPALDPSLPSTLSPKTIDQWLRKELGFQGVIITDCLEMNAIVQFYGQEEAAVKAVEAGVDLLLYSHRADRQKGAIEAIYQAVQEGRIAEERINQSVERILALKQRRKMDEELEEWSVAKEKLQKPESMLKAVKLSEESITIVKNQGAIPLDREKDLLLLWVQQEVTTDVDEMVHEQKSLGQILEEKGVLLTERVVPVNPDEDKIKQIVRESDTYEQIIITSYNAASYPGQAKLIEELRKQNENKLTVIALRNPADLYHFPEVSNYLVCYESRTLALESAAKVLLGEISAKGQLPITL